MSRFLIIIWNESCPRQQRNALAVTQRLRVTDRRWTAIREASGLTVYLAGAASNAGARPLQTEQGVFLGTLFRRGAYTRCESLSQQEATQLGTKGFDLLLRDYWGSYVAVFREPVTRTTRVLRDPSGMQRCFVGTTGGVHILASHIEDYDCLGLTLSVNWRYVAATLIKHGVPHTSQTGIEEISSLLPGESLEIGPAKTRRAALWDATRFAIDSMEDADEARDQVQTEVRRTVHAWSSCHRTIQLMLSGGLDSTVVGCCLRDAPTRPHIGCLNLYAATPGNDEREYARASARHLGFGLVEQESGFAASVAPLLALPKSHRPGTNVSSYVLWGRSITATAREAGASAVYFGQMGDQLFCSCTGLSAAADFAHAHGLYPRLALIALDCACSGGRSLWRSLWDAGRKGWSRGRLREEVLTGRRTLEAPQPFLNPGIQSAIDPEMLRLWPRDEEHVPLGKFLQCSALTYGAEQCLPPWSDEDPAWVWPLHSQPIIELCLRIPQHLHIQNGWDRSMVRQAFAEQIVFQILTRRTKGASVVRHEKLFEKNAELIRELLLDGVLAKQEFLARPAVEKALAGNEIGRTSQGLACALLTETWLRTWVEAPSFRDNGPARLSAMMSRARVQPSQDS